MLLLGSTLLNKPVMSLRTGAPVGAVSAPVFNPHNLKIEGWNATANGTREQGILLSQDIREILPQGFVVDDQDAISDPSELVRFKDVLKLKFELVGKPVITVDKKRLGKVSDFAVDKDTFDIQKIHVAQSMLRSFSSGALIIDRSQVAEINPDKIIVKDTTNPLKSGSPATAPAA